jgi:hypothetical protein
MARKGRGTTNFPQAGSHGKPRGGWIASFFGEREGQNSRKAEGIRNRRINQANKRGK